MEDLENEICELKLEAVNRDKIIDELKSKLKSTTSDFTAIALESINDNLNQCFVKSHSDHQNFIEGINSNEYVAMRSNFGISGFSRLSHVKKCFKTFV